MAKKASTPDFGEKFLQFRHKPKAAIKHLKMVRHGECIAALYRPDIGDIDIVWGEVTNAEKHTGYGLSHIIDKHGDDIKRLGFEVEDFIPIVVQFGNLNLKKSDQHKKVYESRNFRFVIAVQSTESKSKKWLLTAFDIKKRPNK